MKEKPVIIEYQSAGSLADQATSGADILKSVLAVTLFVMMLATACFLFIWLVLRYLGPNQVAG